MRETLDQARRGTLPGMVRTDATFADATVSGVSFDVVTELSVDAERARVHEGGWQSWSPEGAHPVSATSPRPVRPVWQTMAYRPGRPGPSSGFQGEGMLAVDPGDGGPVHVVHGTRVPDAVPSIRAQRGGDGVLRVSADGEVTTTTVAGTLDQALREWAASMATRAKLPEPTSLPSVWCSWYCYWHGVTAADVLANEADARRLGVDVGVIQIDDGWQPAIGDWDRVDPRFGDLHRTVAELRDRGREVGVWLAPFLAVDGSRVLTEHPDWFVDGVEAGVNWNSRLHVLDTTHPGAAGHLHDAVVGLARLGITYFKIDFLYAGAIEGRRHDDVDALAAYRQGLTLIRRAAGPGATVLGCGAPLLPSLGLVDAMRISPDIMPSWEPPDGDVSQPGGRSATLVGAARGHLDRWWVNDPDCLLARPGVERREAWAEHLRATGGMSSCSDPFAALDDWGLEVTRELMGRGGGRRLSPTEHL